MCSDEAIPTNPAHDNRRNSRIYEGQRFKFVSQPGAIIFVALPSLEIADLAARFRGQHGLKTPDALLAATAVRSSATGLITDDRAFRRLPGIEIAVLDDLL